MNKEQELPLRLARELCLRFLERRLLSVSKLPDSLTLLGRGAEAILKENLSGRVLSWAGDLTLRLVERGRLGSPAAALEYLKELSQALANIWQALPPERAEAALKSSLDLLLKLLETNAQGPAPLPETLLKLAQASAALLPAEPIQAPAQVKKKK